MAGGEVEECEICGAKMNDVYIVNVDEVELRVCTKCAKGKKVMSRVSERQSTVREQKMKTDRSDVPQLIENYGRVIHERRESMKLPLKVLAEMINEKETLLLRVEQQRTMPSIELTKKLERALGIRLAEAVQTQTGTRASSTKSEEATLGEFVGNSKK